MAARPAQRARQRLLQRSRDGGVHPQLLDVPGVAAMIGRSRPTVRRWATDGDIPGTRIGGQWRFWQPSLIASVLGPEAAQGEAITMPEGFIEPRVVDVAGLAELLGIHERTLALLVRSGEVPARKTGGRWMAYWPPIRERIIAGQPLAVAAASPGRGRP